MKHKYMTTAQVAEVFSIDRSSVYRGMEHGEIPFIRIGKAYRIPTAWVEEKDITNRKHDYTGVESETVEVVCLDNIVRGVE